MSRYLVLSLLLTAILSLASPSAHSQSMPNAEQLDASLRSCAGQKKIDVDADVSGAIKEAWEGNVLRGKAKVDQFGHIILSFRDETLRLKAYELYTKCLKDYLDTFSRGQHSQTSKQQKTAYDFNGCWQADDTQDKRFIEAKSDKIFKVWTYNSYGKPYACLGEEVEVHVDASNHVVMKRRECSESDDRMTEAYFEKDDVLRIVRTIQRNGAQKSQGQRLIRLLRPEECPQPPPATQQLPPKVSLRNVDTERFKEFAASLYKRASRGTNSRDEAKGWKDEYNDKIHEAKLALKQHRYIQALIPIPLAGDLGRDAEAIATAAKGLEVYLTFFIPSAAFKASGAMLSRRASRGTNSRDEAKGWKDEYNRLVYEAQSVFESCPRIKALQVVIISGDLRRDAEAVASAAKNFEHTMSEEQNQDNFCTS